MRTEESIAIGILLTLFFLASSCTATIYVPDDYTTIPAAVDAASPGDTIIVSDGTYTGNIDVDKSLTIRSENGPDSTIVLDETSYISVFDVTANYVNISGFKVASGGISLHYADYCSITNNHCSSKYEDGISLWDSNNNSITNNHCLNNYYGISLYDSNTNSISDNNCSSNTWTGICLRDSNNNSITNNHCLNNYYGISLWDSKNNSISNNHCLNNEDGIFLIDSNTNRITNNNCLNNEAGITLSDSNNSKLTGNIMLENGISIWGDSISGYTHEIDESNTVNGKSVFYEKDIEGGRVPDGAGQVILVNCSNVVVENQDLNNAREGILIAFSSFITIKNNNCNGAGISLAHSNNSKLTGNIMLENGISIWGDSISDYTHEIDESNTVNGKPVFYWKDIGSGKVPDGAGQVILVNCSNVVVENQDLNNAREGIFIAFSSFNTIKNNKCSSNSWAGISLRDSKNNSISNNNCSNNDGGIYLQDSNDNNKIKNNNCSSNNWYGICLRDAKNNSISNNNCLNNDEGIYLGDSNDNSISNNNCLNNDEGICLRRDSNDNIISNNNCLNNDEGIYLGDSNDNSISNNICSNNYEGIYLRTSKNNSISNNNYTSNNWAGISLDYSNNNLIYLNNFIDNFGNVYSYESTNAWNSTEEITYTYNENTYINYLGNYWDNYKGSDADNDGIGDTSYSIGEDRDIYPLMEPYEKYFA